MPAAPPPVTPLTAGATAQLEATEQRILEGALRALGRHGTDKLRMNAVSDAAGVSRGTLYRYFPTKQHLFAALVEYERLRFAAALEAALDAADGGDRVTDVLTFVARYLADHPALHRLLDDEPGFVLAYLRQHLPFLLETTRQLLGSSIEVSAVVAAGPATEDDVVELLLRVLLSNFLVPPTEPDAVARTVQLLLGAVSRAQVRR